MILQRITVPYRIGMRDQAIHLLKEYSQRAVADGILLPSPQFYVPYDDATHTVGYFKFESVTDMEARWAKFEAAPYHGAFAAAYNPLVDGDMSNMTFEILIDA